MHVLHRTCAEAVKERWRVKPLWMRYFISAGVYIFHPVPPSPRLCALWFSPFLLFAERAGCAALSECSEWVSVLRIVPFFGFWWETLEITMSGGRARTLCSLFHLFPLPLFSLLQMTAMPSAGLLQVRTVWHLLGQNAHSIFFCAHTKLWMRELARTCLRSNIHIKLLAPCTPRTSHHGNEIGGHLPNQTFAVFSVLFAKPWKRLFKPSGVKPARPSLPAKLETRMWKSQAGAQTCAPTSTNVCMPRCWADRIITGSDLLTVRRSCVRCRA